MALPRWTPVHPTPTQHDYVTTPRSDRDLSWKLDGLCLNYDLDTFFPEGRSDSELQRRRIADLRGICEKCPVRLRCIEEALTVGSRHGIWGGTTGRQRARILKAIDRGATTLDAVLESFRTRKGETYEALKSDPNPGNNG